MNKSNKKVVILGDFNIKVDKGTVPDKTLVDFCNRFSPDNQITEVTRLPRRQNHLLTLS